MLLGVITLPCWLLHFENITIKANEYGLSNLSRSFIIWWLTLFVVARLYQLKGFLSWRIGQRTCTQSIHFNFLAGNDLDIFAFVNECGDSRISFWALGSVGL